MATVLNGSREANGRASMSIVCDGDAEEQGEQEEGQSWKLEFWNVIQPM